MLFTVSLRAMGTKNSFITSFTNGCYHATIYNNEKVNAVWGTCASEEHLVTIYNNNNLISYRLDR